jgi:HEAT repeat protein
MNLYPQLTIDRLLQLDDLDLQTDYLNHIDRTPEIAGLLAAIDDRQLALRVVNLALMVDLRLGSRLVSYLQPEFQSIAIRAIDRAEINHQLKVVLWRETKSVDALPYLQKVWMFKERFKDVDYQLLMSAIGEIDRDLSIDLLGENLHDRRVSNLALDRLTELAPLEAIIPIGNYLNQQYFHDSKSYRSAILALHRIGTEEAIAEIRDAFNANPDWWNDPDLLIGLGIVGDRQMVEHLIDLLSQSHDYPEFYGRAIKSLELVGNDLAFDVLERELYWIADLGLCTRISIALFRIDRDRLLKTIACGLENSDPKIRKRSVMVLLDEEIGSLIVKQGPIDRTLEVLLAAMNETEPEILLTITQAIRIMLDRLDRSCQLTSIDPELFNFALIETGKIISKYFEDPQPAMREYAIGQLLTFIPAERDLKIELSGSVFTNTTIDRDWIWKRSDLPLLIEYIDRDRLDLKILGIEGIGRFGDGTLLPIVIPYLKDPNLSLRVAATKAIARISDHTTIPTLLKLATDPTLVTILISQFQGMAIELDHHHPHLNDHFFDLAEGTIIDLVETGVAVNQETIACLGSIGSDRAISSLVAAIDEPELSHLQTEIVLALLAIATDASTLAALELGWYDRIFDAIAPVLESQGQLGIVAYLWNIQQQEYHPLIEGAIAEIQTRSGLYNPNYSDRFYSLLTPHPHRLRSFNSSYQID